MSEPDRAIEFGWDTYLTDRDKKHLRMSGMEKRQPFGFGVRPAVLVIDVYYAALGHERRPILESVLTWPGSCGLEGWLAVDATTGLLASARERHVPVFYSVHIIRDLLRPLSLIGDGPEMRVADMPEPWHALPGDWKQRANEIVDEVAPEPDDIVIHKEAPSAFSGSPLAFHLNERGVDTVIVVGETTSGCVRATVIDAFTQRYKVGVVAECCFDRTEASHYINLFDMDQKYADVVTVSSVIGYLEGLVAC